MRLSISIGLILLLGAVAPWALAGSDIRVKALFPNKAMIEIDGQPKVLSAGDEFGDGMRLIAADFEGALIEVNGEEHIFGLDDSIGGGYATPETQEYRIVSDASGSFLTQGEINGQGVPMIVDTGASWVALSQPHAQQLGLRVDKGQRPLQVQTASGVIAAYPVVLDSVRVGPIERHNIRAAVLESDHPPAVLLGMSFLNQLKMEQSGKLMVLRSDQ